MEGVPMTDCVSFVGIDINIQNWNRFIPLYHVHVWYITGFPRIHECLGMLWNLGKKFQDWKCYGNLHNVLVNLQNNLENLQNDLENLQNVLENLQNDLENLQNVLEKPLVPWIFLEMVKGALKCVEFTS